DEGLLPGAGQDHRADGRRVAAALEDRGQPRDHLFVERVELVRPVDRDDGDPLLLGEQDEIGPHHFTTMILISCSRMSSFSGRSVFLSVSTEPICFTTSILLSGTRPMTVNFLSCDSWRLRSMKNCEPVKPPFRFWDIATVPASWTALCPSASDLTA